MEINCGYIVLVLLIVFKLVIRIVGWVLICVFMGEVVFIVDKVGGILYVK